MRTSCFFCVLPVTLTAKDTVALPPHPCDERPKGLPRGQGEGNHTFKQPHALLLCRQVFEVRVEIQGDRSGYKIYTYLNYKSRKREFGKFLLTGVGRKEGGMETRTIFLIYVFKSTLADVNHRLRGRPLMYASALEFPLHVDLVECHLFGKLFFYV